jgi:hypothetical protein
VASFPTGLCPTVARVTLGHRMLRSPALDNGSVTVLWPRVLEALPLWKPSETFPAIRA